jgi:hypothetical protein
MTLSDKDRPAFGAKAAGSAGDGAPSLPQSAAPPPPPLAQQPAQSQQLSSPVPAEPAPSETRRLPKAAARPAPVLAILRARWPWLVVAGLLGTVAGLLLGASPTWQSSATLRLSGINDPNRVKQVGQTYQSLVNSRPVVALAVKGLAAANGPDGKPNPVPADLRRAAAQTGFAESLAPKVKGVWQVDTDLVSVTVTDSNNVWAGWETQMIAEAIDQYVKDNRDATQAALTAQINAQIARPLANPSAAAAQIAALGSSAASAQAAAILDAASLSVQSSAGVAVPAGASRPVSAGLGGVGGLLVGAVVALLAGAGRRRVRTPGELRSLAPELNLRATTQAGEVAGRLLESGHSTLVVLSLPSTPSSASRFAAAVANHLRTHGSSVTLVNAIALESGDASSMALPDEVWVLRRDIRQDVKAYFSTDVLVVACTAEPEAVGLISGQSDLMAVVVAKEGRSTLQQIWDTVSAVETADPIVVLAP